jgi:hypothetical protein
VTVPNQEIDCQTDSSPAHRRKVGVLTTLAEPLHLPQGWTISRLVELALAELLRSPVQLADTVSRQIGFSVSGVRHANMVLVLETRAETKRLMLGEVDAYQHLLQDLISQQQSVREFQHKIKLAIANNPRDVDSSCSTRSAPVPTRAHTAKRGRRTGSTTTDDPGAAPCMSSATGINSIDNSSDEERYMDELFLQFINDMK